MRIILTTITILILVSLAPAQEKKQDKTKPDESSLRVVMTAPPSQPWGIIYFDDKTGEVKFQGNAEESAKLLFKAFQAVIDEYVAEKLKDCGKIDLSKITDAGEYVRAYNDLHSGKDTLSKYVVSTSDGGKWINEKAPVLTVPWNTPATCTTENLREALRLAITKIKDPNQKPAPIPTVSHGEIYRQDMRTPAERLRDEAKRLEEESRLVAWIRAVQAECEKGKTK